MKQIYIYRKDGKPDVILLGRQTIARGAWTSVTEEQIQNLDLDDVDPSDVLIRDVEDMEL